MAGGSLRKKLNNKRSVVLKPHSSMPSPSPPPSVIRRVSVVVIVMLVVTVLSLLSISSSMWDVFGSNAQSHQIYSVEVVNEFPHDPSAFTQGLLYGGNETLFESTGLHGKSSVRKVALRTGKVEALYNMDYSYFGEGLTLLGERLYQVTWLETTGFIYDRNNLSKFGIFTHEMQDGWGLATDGKVLFGSDGTSTLYHMDPKALKVIRKHTVKYKDHEVHNLNELEYVNGEIWANVWMTDCIARISREDGVLLGWILLPKLREGLMAAGNNNIDVLNGIAWDSGTNRIFVTGKLWPKLFEVKLKPAKQPSDGIIEQMCLRNHRA